MSMTLSLPFISLLFNVENWKLTEIVRIQEKYDFIREKA